MDISWNLYRVFYVVAQSGSTAAASKELMIAQPSVSMNIKQLERQLDCVLFTRSHSGMVLTEHGRILYEHIGRAYRAIGEAEEYLRAVQEAGRSTIGIAVIDTTLHFFLNTYLDEFRALYPEVDIKLHHCTSLRDAEGLLESKAADFAVMHEKSRKEGYESVPIKRIRDILVCGSRFRDRLPAGPLQPEQLKDYPLEAYFKGMPSRNVLDAYLEEQGVQVKLAHEFSHASSMIRQIREQFSLAFLLENSVQYELEQGELVQVELSPPPPCRYYYLIRPVGRQSGLARSLMELMQTESGLHREEDWEF